MIIKPPKIDTRSPEGLLREIKSLVPFYTPEWEPSEGDPGLALINILAHMLETIIHRLNRVPEKNFITFLDKIGTKLLPAQPARVPLTFVLSEGTTGSVRVLERTQAAAGEIVFETEKEILAAPCKLVHAYSISVEKDAIYESPSHVREGKAASPLSAHLAYAATKQQDSTLFLDNASGLAKGDFIKIDDPERTEYAVVSEVSDTRISLTDRLRRDHRAGTCVKKATAFELFEGKNLQEHTLYLGHTDMFNITGGAKITLHIGNTEHLWDLADDKLVRWEYWGERANAGANDDKAPDWYPFDNVRLEANNIVLEKDSDHKVALIERKINGMKSRWIRCVLRLADDTVHPDSESLILELPPEAVRAVGKLFGQRLFARGVSTVGQLLKFKDRITGLARMLKAKEKTKPFEYYKAKAENILENAQKRLLDERYENAIDTEMKSRRILTAADNIGTVKDTRLASIQLTSQPIVPEYCDLPAEAVRGVGMSFGPRLSAAGANTVGQLVEFKNRVTDLARILLAEEEGKSLEYYKEKAENILENAQKRVLDECYEAASSTENRTQGIHPDMAFQNDVPLDLDNLSAEDPIYPFGKTPGLYDTFYIASQEGFSKKDATITLYFTFMPSTPSNSANKPHLSWEYFNGKGWMALTKDFHDGTNCFTSDKNKSVRAAVTFCCPDDMERANVNNQESYWIRVKLVGGDYGKAVEILGVNEVGPGTFDPPEITKLTIGYCFSADAPLPLHHCLTYNNLEFRDVTEESRPGNGKSFKPFLPLEDSHQALYLGFDKKLEKGPISIFFWLEEQQYLEENMPRVVWEYYAEKEGEREWTRLMVLDETRNLTRSGTIQLVFPPHFVKNRSFGKEAYWIRALDIENKFAPSLKAIAQSGEAFEGQKLHPRTVKDYILPAANSVIDCSERIEPCRGQLQVFHPAWSVLSEAGQYPPAPRIRGIYLNTTWAVQAETVEDEILGSSDGTKGQTFTSTKAPVISEEIWVNELSALSEGQRKDLLEEGEPKVNEVKDEKGNATEFWVKWQPVDDLLGSSKNSRDYEIDRTFGQIKFGDGTNGRIPPMGTDSIKANYTSGGGKKANVAVSEISTLSTSIPFVDKVSNPAAAGGGSDTEVIENALERGPQIVRHRNRAVTEEDFEWLAKQASRNIVRAQCLANFDDRGEFRAGWVTVLAVPESKEDRPKLSLQLKSHLERYLKERCPGTIVPERHLRVIEPVYAEVSVESRIVSTTVDALARIEKNAFSRLREFLHPLTGGHEKKGWDFGRMPCLSDFFELLEKIPEVSHVETLLARIRTDGEELVITPEMPSEVETPPYTLIYSGEHKIIVTYEGEV